MDREVGSQRSGSGTARRAMTSLLAGGLAVLALVGCGDDPPEDYTQETADAFLEACTEPLEDDLLHIELCQCVFEASQREMPYAEFARLEVRLREEPTAALPPALVSLIARCVVDLAEL